MSTLNHPAVFVYGLIGLKATVSVCLISKVQESPEWLASRGQFSEARRVLTEIAGTNQTEAFTGVLEGELAERLPVVPKFPPLRKLGLFVFSGSVVTFAYAAATNVQLQLVTAA